MPRLKLLVLEYMLGVYDFVRNNKNIAFGCFEKSLNTVTRSVNYRQQNEETMPMEATTAAATSVAVSVAVRAAISTIKTKQQKSKTKLFSLRENVNQMLQSHRIAYEFDVFRRWYIKKYAYLFIVRHSQSVVVMPKPKVWIEMCIVAVTMASSMATILLAIQRYMMCNVNAWLVLLLLCMRACVRAPLARE